MSTAISAFGTLLKMGDGTGTAEQFTTIANVGDIKGPGSSVDTMEVTNHSSAGARKEKLAGLIDSGEVSFAIFFVPDDATHNDTTGLQAKLNARALVHFRIVYPDASQCALSALVTKFDTGAPVQGGLSADVTLSVSGPLVWS